MNKCLSILLLLVFSLVAAGRPAKASRKVKYPGGKTYMFRVMLADKRGTPFSIDNPSAYLSAKAIERRRRQRLAVDSTDLPVNPAYIRMIRSTGVDVVGVSKWNNTVLVRSRKLDCLRSVSRLACVKEVRKVWTSPDSITVSPPRSHYHTEFNRWDTVAQTHYGVTREQVEMLGGVKMHSHRFTGQGVTIAVLDGGFMNADQIPCLKEVDVVGWRDFVVPPSNDMAIRLACSIRLRLPLFRPKAVSCSRL